MDELQKEIQKRILAEQEQLLGEQASDLAETFERYVKFLNQKEHLLSQLKHHFNDYSLVEKLQKRHRQPSNTYFDLDKWVAEYIELSQLQRQAGTQEISKIYQYITTSEKKADKEFEKLPVSWKFSKATPYAANLLKSKEARKQDKRYKELEYWVSKLQHQTTITKKLLQIFIQYQHEIRELEETEQNLIQILQATQQRNTENKQNNPDDGREIQNIYRKILKVHQKQKRKFTNLLQKINKGHSKIKTIAGYKHSKTLSSISAIAAISAYTIITGVSDEPVLQRDFLEHFAGILGVFSGVAAAFTTTTIIIEVAQRLNIWNNVEK